MTRAMPWIVMAGFTAVAIVAVPPDSNSNLRFVFVVASALAAFLYFLPWVIAVERRATTANGIILLDVLAGWTFIGWVVALVWAVSAPTSGSEQSESALPATKRCPECAEEVQAAAKICRFCRYEFDSSAL